MSWPAGKRAIAKETSGMRKECAELRLQAAEYAWEIKAAKQLSGLSCEEIVMKCSIADQLNARIEELKRDDPEESRIYRTGAFRSSRIHFTGCEVKI